MGVSQDPAFSVIIASRNAARHIGEALDSLLAYGGARCEVIVADGNSSDSTTDVLAQYEPQFGGRLRWISEPDCGIYDAMNKGLAMASAEWVVFLGADDRLAEGAFAAVEKRAADAGGADIVCGATHVFGQGADFVELPRSFRAASIPKRAPARHQSIYVRRQALLAIGGFDTRWPIAADYDAYLRLCEVGAEEALSVAVLSEFRLGGVSSTLKVRTAAEYRDIRIAHGATPTVEHLVMLKSLAAVWVFAALRRAGLARGARR